MSTKGRNSISVSYHSAIASANDAESNARDRAVNAKKLEKEVAYSIRSDPELREFISANRLEVRNDIYGVYVVRPGKTPFFGKTTTTMTLMPIARCDPDFQFRFVTGDLPYGVHYWDNGLFGGYRTEELAGRYVLADSSAELLGVIKANIGQALAALHLREAGAR